MRYIVESVDTNAMAGKYPVTKLQVHTEAGQQKKWNFFKKDPLINIVNQLVPGKTIEVELVQNGQYWNPSSILVLPDALVPVSPASPGVAGGGNGGSNDQFRTKEELRRTAALDAAIRLAAVLKGDERITVPWVLNQACDFADFLEKGVTEEDAANLLDSNDDGPY